MPLADGHRQQLADLADECESAALEQKQARHAGGNRVEHLACASIDAERLMLRIADRLRKMRR